MNTELNAQVRLGRNKRHKQDLLKRGFIPAVVYGKNMESFAISVNVNELKKILEEAGSNALIHMKIRQNEETTDHQVLVKSVQHEPVQRTLIHADFHQVSLKDKVFATINIHLTGIAPGIAKGGVLTQQIWGLEVECLASSIPDTLMVDISSLDIGEEITLADLVLPPGVKAIGDGHAHVAAIAAQAGEAALPAKEETPA
ncbi:MAG: 50S ribosomal protein L25 [Desulfotomaculaceae bacterium]